MDKNDLEFRLEIVRGVRGITFQENSGVFLVAAADSPKYFKKSGAPTGMEFAQNRSREAQIHMSRLETNPIVPQDFPKLKNDSDPGASSSVREVVSYGSRTAMAWRRDRTEGSERIPSPSSPPSIPWRKLWRYKGTITVIFLLVVVPPAVGVWNLMVPKYTAVGKIRVRPIIPRLVFQTDENGLIPYYDYYANTQADLIRSPQILQKVLDQPAVKETHWFQAGREYGPEALVDRLVEGLSAQYKPKTEIVEVALTTENPRDAVVIVNGLMAEYLRFVKTNADQARDFMYQKLSESYDVLQDEIENRKKAAGELRKEVAGGAKEKFQRLSDEEEVIRHKQDLAATLRSRLDQKEFERSVPGSMEVVAPAVVPSEPSEDRRKKMTLAVVFAALGVGLGVGYLRVRAHQTLDDPEDFVGIVEEPFLGRLPFIFPKKPLKADQSAMQADAVRRMRTFFLLRFNDRPGNTIAFTSARYGAGKTTVAILLAKSLVLAGKKVLLVEANIKSPAIAEYFGVPKGPGLMGFLNHSQTQNQVVKTDHPLLDLLPAGSAPAKASTDLFADGTLAGLLRQWKEPYDFILVDAPPILSAAEGAMVAQLTDATVLAVRRYHCRREDLAGALENLEACGAAIVGLVYVT
jgi:capsular exopolysaccharide synthesis family protein